LQSLFHHQVSSCIIKPITPRVDLTSQILANLHVGKGEHSEGDGYSCVGKDEAELVVTNDEVNL